MIDIYKMKGGSEMSKIMSIRYDDVHIVPATPVFLTDEEGNVITASVNEDDKEEISNV